MDDCGQLKSVMDYVSLYINLWQALDKETQLWGMGYNTLWGHNKDF